MASTTVHEFERSPTFLEHGCRIAGIDRIRMVDWFKIENIRVSKISNYPSFIHPIEGFRNHVIWGSGYAHDRYGFGGVCLEALVEDLLKESNENLILSSLDLKNSIILEVEKFSFRLASEFLEWAGFAQEFFVLSPKKSILFMRNEELEYALYCRDQAKTPTPFEGVSDSQIAEAFSRAKADFANAGIDSTRLPHLRMEILPYCDETLAR